ncbi:MAG: peptidoglycan-binding domain-containing protein [Pseudolabrys sp.]
MKQLMLATVATIALSLPAMAQSSDMKTTTPADQTQMNSQSQSSVDPSTLSTQQIRRVQTALEKNGADIKHADGKWGPQTEAAVKDFQQKQNIQGNGKLDQQTLAALGVTMNDRQEQGSATTGSGSRESRMNRPSQNPGRMHNGTTGQSSGSMEHGSSSMGPDSPGSSGGAYGQSGSSKPSVNDGH